MRDLQTITTRRSLCSPPNMKKRPLILPLRLPGCPSHSCPPPSRSVLTIILNFVCLYSFAFFMILLPMYVPWIVHYRQTSEGYCFSARPSQENEYRNKASHRNVLFSECKWKFCLHYIVVYCTIAVYLKNNVS